MAYVISTSYFATLTVLGCQVPRRFWSLPRHVGRRRTLGDLFSTGFGQGGAHASLLPPISECVYACVHVCPCTKRTHHCGHVCVCMQCVRAACQFVHVNSWMYTVKLCHLH